MLGWSGQTKNVVIDHTPYLYDIPLCDVPTSNASTSFLVRELGFVGRWDGVVMV